MHEGMVLTDFYGGKKLRNF